MGCFSFLFARRRSCLNGLANRQTRLDSMAARRTCRLFTRDRRRSSATTSAAITSQALVTIFVRRFGHPWILLHLSNTMLQPPFACLQHSLHLRGTKALSALGTPWLPQRAAPPSNER